jgi:glycosyltransferase involved in cell wall biosynthesis
MPHTSALRLQDLGPPWFTIVHPFFDDEKRLDIQLEAWGTYTAQQKDCLEFIISDDHSKVPVHKLLEGKDLDVNLRVYRVDEDIRWNTPGALNLGITNSTTHWTMIMDSDCLLEPEQLQILMDLRPDEKFFYFFDRKRVTKDEEQAKRTRFLPCTILFNRPAFEGVHGFDEDFSGGGYAYFDSDFVHKLWMAGYWVGKLNKQMYVTEYMESEVGPNVQQRTGVTKDNYRVNKHIYYDKKAGRQGRSEDILRFPWSKTFEHRRNS